jgi:hypothetical protein
MSLGYRTPAAVYHTELKTSPIANSMFISSPDRLDSLPKLLHLNKLFSLNLLFSAAC